MGNESKTIEVAYEWLMKDVPRKDNDLPGRPGGIAAWTYEGGSSHVGARDKYTCLQSSCFTK